MLNHSGPPDSCERNARPSRLPVSRKGTPMTTHNVVALAALTFLAFPLAAHAQSGGAATGAATGAVGGAIVGGPVGAVVGGVGGAIVGGLADEQRPQFRQYVVQQRPQSYRYQQEVRVGAVLPSSGV